MPSSAVYNVHTMSLDNHILPKARGRDAFPPDVPYWLQTAIMKLDCCDLSLLAFLAPASDLLRKIGARVDWFIVMMKPQVTIKYDGESAGELPHSVFSVTTRSGEQFIADFTLEQYGYDEKFWFNRKIDYLNLHTTNGIYRIVDDEELRDLEDRVRHSRSVQETKKAARLICDELNFAAYRELPEDHRSQSLRLMVEAVYRKMQSE